MKATTRLVAVGALVVAALALVLATPAKDAIPGLIDLTADRLPPPPEIRLRTPADGDGVGDRVFVTGEATSPQRGVTDVQYRIGEGRWEPVPLAARGQAATPFAIQLDDLAPGDHVLEVRATDGESLSIPARVTLRRDAPTVDILEPSHGAGVPSGTLLVSGTVLGRADEVLLELDGNATTVSVAGNAWSATLELPPGEHTLRATALGETRSLPRTVRIAAGPTPPPALTILAPRQDSAYGGAGDLTCGGGCILVTGTAPGATRVRVDVDGLPAGDAAPLATGAWTFRIPMTTLANGTHHATFRPIDHSGQAGVAGTLRFTARTPLGLAIRGDDAPAPTGSPLRFEAIGENAASATWTLNGAPAAHGASVTLTLDKPGDHLLSVQTRAPAGRSATGSLVLHAQNRAPHLAFVGDPAFLDGATQIVAQGTDPDGDILAYRWELGDGTTLDTKANTVLHTYRTRGTFVVNLTAIDDHGATTRISRDIHVINAAPVPSFDWSPAAPTILDAITLRDTSVDHDGTLVERRWRLPDGNVSTNRTPTLRLHERGPHRITLSVIDELGADAHLTRILDVANIPPEPAFRHDPPLPRTHEEVLFADATTDVDGPLATWRWDFGDGTTADGATLLHIYRSPGNYTVRLHVTDDAGATANITRNITIADSPPTIHRVLHHPERPRAQEPVRLSVVADDRDGSILAAHWEFGDGTQSNLTEPTHLYPRSGWYDGNVTVYDEGGLHVRFPFQILINNTPPHARLHVLGATAPTAAYPTHLHANATDPDGRIVYYEIDADGDTIPDCQTTQPHCTHVYEHAGTYTAHLTVHDDEGASTTTQTIVDVTLPPTNRPPPTPHIESPRANTTLRGDHLIRGSATAPRDIAHVDLQLRAGPWAYSGSRDPWRRAYGTHDWTALVDTRGFHDGDYELVIRATDTDGGTGYTRIPIRIQNGPRPSEVTLQLVEPPTHIDTPTILRASAFHPEGITNVRWRIDTDTWTTETENPLAFTIPIDPADLTPGEHVLRIEAYHGPSQTNNATHVFTIPGTRPTLIIDTPPNAEAYALIHAEGRIHGQGRAQWRIDNDIWQNLPPGDWNLTIDTLPYRGGNHTLHLRAITPDGRLTSDQHTYRIHIINPPFTESDQHPSRPQTRETPGANPTTLLGTLAAIAAATRATRRR